MTTSETRDRDPWLGVEVRHLAALSAVADTGSFRGAAARLGYVQSTVSQQIALLERLVGQRLVERSRGARPLALTEAGQLLVCHAGDIVGRLRAARADLAALGRGSTVELRIGVRVGCTGSLLAEALGAYTRHRPGIRASVEEALDEGTLVDLVEGGRIDVAFVDLPVVRATLATCELLSDPFVALVRPGSALTTLRRPPRAIELASQRVIVPASSEGVAERLREHDIPVDSTLGSLTDAAARNLAAGGLGVAILPKLSVTAGDSATAAIDLGDLLAPRVVGLCWHRDRELTDPVRRFCAAAQRAAGRLRPTEAALPLALPGDESPTASHGEMSSAFDRVA
jgi:DNA-binding transcriptional LysR family regulator